MKNICAILILAFLYPLYIHAGWQRSVTNYTRHKYKAASQNWDIIQQKNGWMYFANNKGLLEYDGTNWAVYPINNAKMRTLKQADDGRIYVGGLKQFGYFKPDPLGELHYVCLSDCIPKSETGNIWDIIINGKTVYYRADRSIFVFKDEKLSNIPCEPISIALWRNELYVYIMGSGLCKLTNGKLIPQSSTGASHELLSSRVKGMFPYKDGLLVVTEKCGLHFYHNKTWSEYHIKDTEQVWSSRIFCSAINKNCLAVGTVQNGVFLIDLQTRRIEHISTHNGLQNKTVLSAAFDKENNLWLGLDNGIDCIHINSPVFRYCNGIGGGYVSCPYQEKLYLGTNQGLFETVIPKIYDDKNTISPINVIAGQIYSLSIHDHKLFCSGSDGLWTISPDNHIRKIKGIRGVWQVIETENSNLLLAATYTGFCLLHKDSYGNWAYNGKRIGMKYSSKSLCNEPQNKAIWTANKEDGLFRLVLSKNSDSIISEKCYNSPDLPKGNNVCISIIDQKVTIASRNGIFRYNRDKGTIERDTLLENVADGTTSYTYIHQDSLGNIWYVANGALKILHYDSLLDKYIRNENEVFFSDALIEDFEHVHVTNEPKGEAIIGLEDGFALLHAVHTEKTNRPDLSLQIRKVYLKGVKDSLIYGSSYLPFPIPKLRIPYSHNSIRICYGTTGYDKSLVQSYSCKLEGPIGESWTEATPMTEKEYLALPEGKYKFSVSTYVDYGKQAIISLPFEILPPWYRCWWAYVIYIMVLLGILFTVYYRIEVNHRRLVMKKEQEYVRENERKNIQIDTLQEEKLQADLRYKSEELIRTTMNIVRKNEMLMNIRKEVQGISHSINEENLVALRRKTLRLLGQIETNMEHDNDLNAFQNSFDSVHHNFFKQLEALYPELTTKDKMLCAYIKMNLLSKEIAPLLNISLRGVEISRYRLRKKLKLSEGESLAEFLQKLAK